MNTDSVTRNLRVLWRANAIIAEIRIRALLAKSGMQLFAVLMAASGLLMLGYAGFLFLSERYGPVVAALIVGGVNLFIALLALLFASRVRPSRDLELAIELQKAASEALLAEARGFEQLLKRPLDAVLPPLLRQVLTPGLGTLLRLLRSIAGFGGKDGRKEKG